MSADEALRLATWVEGLFADVTPQQVAFLADQFEAFDAAIVQAEVTRFRRHFDALVIANLLRRISDEQQKQARPRRSGGEREQVDQQWKQIDAKLNQLSDAELDRRKRAVIDRHPGLASFLRDRDPRTSVVLRSLIAREKT